MSNAKNQYYFKNLQKQPSPQNTIKKLIINDTEVTYQAFILNL